MDYKEARKLLTERLDTLGVSVVCTHIPVTGVPYKDLRMNFLCAVTCQGRAVLTCEFGAGIGHCTSYIDKRAKGTPGSGWMLAAKQDAIKNECATGKGRHIIDYAYYKPIPGYRPTREDVFSSLVMDGDAINYSTFEGWADNYGYDTDSRKGEAVYRACLAHGLALRAALGDTVFRELTELCNEL
jgi:hypothetical protein